MKNIISLFALLLLFACNRGSQVVETPENFDATQVTSIMKNPGSISKESIAEIAGTDATKIKVYIENFSPDITKRAVLFSWPTGDEKTIKAIDGKTLTVEGYNSLGLGFLTKTNKEAFQKKFESNASIQEEINRITKDETLDADLAISEAKHLAANAKTQQFEKLGNIAELAYWETPVNALHVFAKGISFTVTSNFTNEQVSKEKAIEFTQFIFNQPLKSSK
ncbi:hypothetical protein [Pedobacter insulae]|uniref:Lipoprotein n=1 Tax=Pedobacter insulae TaxID=414048 RepID=A0A1I2XHU9_9SPHI|nr:hypothetical protein [Pedobacter insulae]SFH12609.1 hypothetical protein SAMN04489864_105230 [Pedobacter insulae]